jgi:catechol 2,3-dioxygenase-like lactoylglutathione lyase family enzyme
MDKTKAVFKNAWPYQKDKMNLPVNDVDAAIPFYETMMGFTVLAEHHSPYKKAILVRDNIEIGLAENGGDPTQDGCFFEADNVENAFEELRSKGLNISNDFRIDKRGETTWKLFFVIAPDGLCYCIGEKQK